ncbi:receptor-mediated endocytosis protein 6 homolog [Ixodes scapularis]|uniref:receptor-mediated endocytosis protein 6 homolog n=1 Tax=Ixodes scapularis TaxID=6945 RepID=UPI001A9FEFAA|nr:receptor-mediated endocytosis protein 6 homolog [Ixodes scapularis]XP_029846299.2 receptor-mediated endocytosis protein 6 homolog [Ixodes scapularis]
MGLKRGSTGSLRAELAQIASRLRREHLFVDSEKRELQRLNERVQRLVERLQHLSWIWRHQRNALDALVLGREGSPASCCQRLNALEAACFVDSYRALGAHDNAYAVLLRGLRQEPALVAVCLVRGPSESLRAAVDILVSCVYGCGTLPEDQSLVLGLLRELMVLQLEGCDNVRRLLQHGSCAFSRVYKAFTEGLPGAQLFLTSALRSALIQVLVDDDLYLDIDPSKAVVRFPAEERLRHFGSRDSADYARRLGAYRSWTLERLARLAQGFVEGLRSSWLWFPPALASLVRRLHSTLTQGGGAGDDPRAGVVCADLVFAFFVCPAVVSPELHGLVDTHISAIARFNLMQVAQIIQMLALARWERPDPRLADLYDRFPRDCVSSLLDSLLGEAAPSGPSSCSSSQGAASSEAGSSHQQGELARAAFLATEAELATLVSFLRGVTWPAEECSQQKVLESLLGPLPPPTDAPKRVPTKVSTPKKGDGEDDSGACESQPEEVLVIPMPDFNFECPGMLSEDKVLSLEQQKRQTRVRMNVERAVADACDGGGVETIEKRTRFSLSQDQESIGTSDNLEAVSEGASNHSVASSLELENENDNFSDMVSANVSGHGTPNVSGRDTPSSQVEEEEPMERPPTNQNQADIEDKFGKFEISPAAPVQGDETKSIVSDTWSTDVLASDSEMLDQVNLTSRFQTLESQLQSALEIGDTGSDAWSTDVTASDNERLQDVDTDDTGSLARSDDTRSEVSGGGDEELALPPVLERHAHRHAHHHHHHHHRHHRRSSLKLPPQSPKQLLSPQQPLGAHGGGDFATTLLSPLSPGQGVGPAGEAGALPSPQSHSAQGQSTDGVDSGMSSAKTSAGAPLQPSDMSLFDPLAVQVELRHPERLRCQDSALGAEGGEEDVTPTGTQATPSPSGGSGLGRSGSASPARRDRLSPGGGTSPTLDGMQSLGRLSLAVKELPEEEALLLLQGDEETAKAATGGEDDRTGDKRSKNFFKSKLSQFRFSFKPKQRKSNEGTQNGPDLQRSFLPDVGSEAADILEKYRGCTTSGGGSNGVPTSPTHQQTPQGAGSRGAGSSEVPPTPGAGLTNGNEESLLEDAQRKLRLVLALADLPSGGPQEPVALLQGLLAQATLLQHKALVSHVHEALRCLRLLDELQCLRVLRGLEEEHRRRAPYVAYLVRCRQGLLSLQAQLEMQLRRTQRDRDVCQTHLATLCVRHFLDPREHHLQTFSRSFQGLTVGDEKAQLVEKFLQFLFRGMEVDPTWQMASDLQMSLAQHTIERAIMSQIYVHALYPNGDGDVLRDQVLHQHIQKLSRVVTVDHRDLRIPRAYHAECPWPSAQAHLGALAAHKSPRDKVACVAACCSALMSLLSLAGGVPAADDLIPVLVYVLIQANPPHLLSTVQFVNTFHQERFEGEAAYWWTQFCSAVEFIKTMDY